MKKLYVKKLSTTFFFGTERKLTVESRVSLKNQGLDEIQIYGIFAFCWLKRALRIKFYFFKRVIERRQPYFRYLRNDKQSFFSRLFSLT